MSGFWRRMLGGSPGAAADEPASGGTAAEGLSRYELGVELGRGAMAVVHRATDKRSGAELAIKRLHLQREFAAEDLADVRERFMREARAVRHLRHPDILQVLDAGESGKDAWIAMDFAPGRDLSHFTRTGQLLSVMEAVAIGVRLARALHYAHSQGVVHRDIKPANVMYDPDSRSLKIMDFGIARIADGTRTRTGLVLGTPSFMSPEQLAGLKVDGRSDLYSLGVLLFQLLTGRLPHQSDSMAKLMNLIATQAPPDIRHFRPELPEALALVLALALEKRPELRYANGEQMAQDLEAVQAQLPAQESAAPTSADAQTGPPADPAFAQTLRLTPREPGQNP